MGWPQIRGPPTSTGIIRMHHHTGDNVLIFIIVGQDSKYYLYILEIYFFSFKPHFQCNQEETGQG
jgi:hypothetical protein